MSENWCFLHNTKIERKIRLLKQNKILSFLIEISQVLKFKSSDQIKDFLGGSHKVDISLYWVWISWMAHYNWWLTDIIFTLILLHMNDVLLLPFQFNPDSWKLLMRLKILKNIFKTYQLLHAIHCIEPITCKTKT